MIKTVDPALHWSGNNTPRAWQQAALPLALDALTTGKWAVVRAIMGAGKSILQAELAASIELEPDQVILFTVPTVKLVHQLADTLSARVAPRYTVSKYCTDHSKQLGQVNVCCHPSLLNFVIHAQAAGKRVIWVADECHKTEADNVLGPISQLQLDGRIGFTATPWRAQDSESISSFRELVFDYGPGQGIADGVVVDIELINILGSCRVVELDEQCIEWIIDEGPGGIVNAIDIDDADTFSAKLKEAGVRHAVIHSKVPKKVQQRALAEHKAGAVKVLIHVNMLAEGVDMPWLQWLVARRDVQSSVRFPQEVGRIMRAYPGKSAARVYDPHNIFGRMSLTLEAVLGDPLPKIVGEAKAAPERTEREAVMLVGINEVEHLVNCMRRHFTIHHDVTYTPRKTRKPMLGSIVPQTQWWDRPASESQTRFIKGLLGDVGAKLPEKHKITARALYLGRIPLTNGLASDIITTLKAMKAGKSWNS